VALLQKTAAITKWAWQVLDEDLPSNSASHRSKWGEQTVEQLNVPKDHSASEGVLKARFIYPNLKLRVYTTGMRQNRLAKLVGIDEAYLSRIINGVRVPGKHMQQQIAEVLGCDAEWLFQQATIQVPAEMSREGAKLG
jgi:plasmid maintenance system antidote protein VapI